MRGYTQRDMARARLLQIDAYRMRREYPEFWRALREHVEANAAAGGGVYLFFMMARCGMVEGVRVPDGIQDGTATAAARLLAAEFPELRPFMSMRTCALDALDWSVGNGEE